ARAYALDDRTGDDGSGRPGEQKEGRPEDTVDSRPGGRIVSRELSRDRRSSQVSPHQLAPGSRPGCVQDAAVATETRAVRKGEVNPPAEQEERQRDQRDH